MNVLRVRTEQDGLQSRGFQRILIEARREARIDRQHAHRLGAQLRDGIDGFLDDAEKRNRDRRTYLAFPGVSRIAGHHDDVRPGGLKPLRARCQSRARRWPFTTRVRISVGKFRVVVDDQPQVILLAHGPRPPQHPLEEIQRRQRPKSAYDTDSFRVGHGFTRAGT